MLADIIEDDEARAATLRNTAFHRALSRIVDGKGDFPASLPWGYLENRHLIRAIDRGAIALWDAGDTDAALDIFRKLLKSNPNDNIGARDLYHCHPPRSNARRTRSPIRDGERLHGCLEIVRVVRARVGAVPRRVFRMAQAGREVERSSPNRRNARRAGILSGRGLPDDTLQFF